MGVRVALALVLSLAATSAPAVAAQPRPGTLDLEFPRPLQGYFPYRVAPAGVAIHPDGRVISAAVGERNWVTAHTPDGRLDPAFGSGGEVQLRCPPDSRSAPCGTPFQPAGMAIAPDGGILLAGGTTVESPYAVRRLTIWRLTAAGRPDPGFGDGGQITLDVGGHLVSTDLAIQADGRILAAIGKQVADGYATAVLRLLPDGRPDSSYGSGGRTEVSPVANDTALAIDSRGAAVVISNHLWTLTRLLPDGSPDAAFAANRDAAVQAMARRGLDAGSFMDVVLRPDGRLLLATSGVGRDDRGLALLGLLPDGRLDSSFGRGGFATLRHPRRGYYESGWTATIDQRGGILVGGGGYTDDLFSDTGLVVGRFRPDGRPDRSFGDRGVAFVPSALTARGLAVAWDGKILSTGVGFDRSGFLGADLVRLHGGYDDARPRIFAGRLCARDRAVARVRIADLSRLARVTVRAAGKRLRVTQRKRFRVRAPRGARYLTVVAEDLAENRARRRIRLPRCD